MQEVYFYISYKNIFVFNREIRDTLRIEIAHIQKKLPNFSPGLAIVQVGGRDDSNVYIRMKIKAALDIGIRAEHIKLPKSTTEDELLKKVTFCFIIY